MIDELDLAFEDHDRGRSRHRRSSQRRPLVKKKKKRKSRTGLALILTLVLLGGLGGGVYVAYDRIAAMFLTPDFDGTGSSEAVTIEIKQGDLLADIGNTLVRAGVVKSAQAFIQAAEKNPESKGIQPGFYKLNKQQSGASAVLALLDLKNRIVKGITIPEHLISIQIFDKLSKELGIPVAEFKKAAANPVALGVPDWWFKRGDGKKGSRGIEGFLYPSTYEFPPNVTAAEALKMMVEQFLTVTSGMKFAETVQAKLGISPYEALITASITQAESMDDKDLAPVARVIYNRAYKPFDGCCLGIDSAVNYSLRIQGKIGKDSRDILSSEQHNLKDPYNTFDVRGLPYGPIGNPGELALKAAMDPPKNDYFYFMTIDAKGTMAYAKDFPGHCRNYDKAVQNGILTGDC